MTRMPSEVAEIRQEICRLARCVHADAAYADPCAACPEGHWKAYAPPDECDAIAPALPSRGLGDLVAAVAQPIARALDAAIGTDLANCAGCKQRQAWLNEHFPGPAR